MSSSKTYKEIPITLNTPVTGQLNAVSTLFPSGMQLVPGTQVALKKVLLNYSWFNITAAYGNNTFSYIYEGNTRAVTIKDGFYDAAGLNNALQFAMGQNGDYLVDNNSVNQYYLAILVNPTYYGISIQATPTPTALPTGWTVGKKTTDGSAGTSLNAAGKTPQFIVNNTAFGKLIGYSNQTYPSGLQSVQVSTVGDKVPQMSIINAISLNCNFVSPSNFNVSTPQSILIFSPSNTSFGSQINIEPVNYSWYDCSNGYFQSVQCWFTDSTTGAALPNLDNAGGSIIVTLILRIPDS